MLPSTPPAPQSVLLKWVNFVLGSLMIHLSGFWLLQNAPLRPVSVELQSDTIPVEYIDSLPPTVPNNPSPPAIPPQSSPSRPSASPRLNPSPMTAATPQATPQSSPAASPRVNPSPRTAISPPPSPSPVVRPTPVATPSPPPTPRVSPPPSPPPVVRPTPVATPSPPATSRVSPLPSPPPVVRPTPVATPSPPPPSPVVRSTPASTSVPTPVPTSPPLSPSPAASSQGILATILGVQSGNGGRDEPNQLAQPQIQQQSFPSLVYPLGNQPTVLQVRLLIDAQGRPEVQSILQGSDRPEIRRFVEDLMQDWQFSPALSGGEPVYSFLDVSVRITPSGS